MSGLFLKYKIRQIMFLKYKLFVIFLLRNAETEYQPVFIGNSYPASVHGHGVSYNRESEPCSAGCTRAPFVNTVKPFKNMWKAVFWNTRAIVAYGEVAFVVGNNFYFGTAAV